MEVLSTNTKKTKIAIVLCAVSMILLPSVWYFMSSSKQMQSTNNSPIIVGPSTVAEGEEVGSGNRYSYYATERYWVWYQNSSTNGYIGFKTSINGSDWSNFTAVRPCTVSPDFSIWLEESSRRISLVYADFLTNGESIYYRRGILSDYGNISWETEEQIAVRGEANIRYGSVSIVADSNEYPWVCYRWHNASSDTYYPYVTKSQWNNGSWSTQAGFPYKLSNASDDDWISTAIPLDSGKMYVIYDNCYSSAGTYGKLYYGDWGSEETITVQKIYVPTSVSAVGMGDNVYFAFVEARPSFDIHFIERTYASGWKNIEDIRLSLGRGDTSPDLSLDMETGEIYCFYTIDTNVYYSKRTNGGWINETSFAVDTTLCTGSLQASYQSYGSRITICWLSGNSEIGYKIQCGSLIIG